MRVLVFGDTGQIGTAFKNEILSNIDVITIPKEAKHQVTNIGETDLVFVEIQLGEYFGEDDIVRLEDKYGRV